MDSSGVRQTDLANLLTDIPAQLPDELVQTIVRAPAVQIVRVVSRGQCSPPGFWYYQEENEYVLLLTGAARLVFEDQTEPLEMIPGSCVNIPAHKRHRVEWTDPTQNTVWLGIFY
jgi:cupin 2 domain-containing protein